MRSQADCGLKGTARGIRRVGGWFLWLAVASTAVAANTAPLVTILKPQSGASSVSPTESLLVLIQDDQPLLPADTSLLLNGSPPGGGFVGIDRMDDGRTLRFELAAALVPNMDYLFQVACGTRMAPRPPRRFTSIRSTPTAS